jgi:membrane protein YdbS with pleckstrin-like domain
MTPSRPVRNYTPIVVAVALALGAGIVRATIHSGPWPSIAAAAGVLAAVIFLTVGLRDLRLIARQRPRARRER